MTTTDMHVRSPKNPPETIIDNTKEAFVSPLDFWIKNFCEHCPHWKHHCRPEDRNGIDRMMLCISLKELQVTKGY